MVHIIYKPYLKAVFLCIKYNIGFAQKCIFLHKVCFKIKKICVRSQKKMPDIPKKMPGNPKKGA